MKVKIYKTKYKNVWYKNRIGEVVEVQADKKGLYAIADNPFFKLYKEDCSPIVELQEETNDVK